METSGDRTDASVRSSRCSAADAGWDVPGQQRTPGSWETRLRELKDRRWRDFSWLTARALLDSANDKIAKSIHDLVNPRRERWMAAQRAAGAFADCPDLVMQRPDWTRCLLLGDPGEADGSQYAVVAPMLWVHKQLGSDFMVILSDVIYPAGDVNQYVNGFYEAYRDYPEPILAIPGNHDWYDGLNGFMFHFCGAEALPPTAFRRTSYSAPERIASLLWRRADRPDRTLLRHHRARRHAGGAPPQPAPYWAMDMAGVRLVAIDTGIKGTLDREQGEWLLRVSADDDDEQRPKVLLTGKPLWVNGEYRRTPIDWGKDLSSPKPGLETVDDIVRCSDFGYVAAIGGDVHNYQRLTVTVVVGDPDAKPRIERPIEYVVAGGSGAYTSATHSIGRVEPPEPKQGEPPLPKDVAPIQEQAFRCYPTRGDSLAYYSRWFGGRVVTARTVALQVLVAAIVWAIGWALVDDVEHGLGWVALAAACGFIGIPLLVYGVGLGTHMLFPRGYRTVGVLLVVPVLLTLSGGLLAWLLGEGTWDWVWKAMLLGLGTLLAPVVLILAGYYGLSSERRLKRDLLGCAIVVLVIVLYAERLLGLEITPVTVAAAVLGGAALLLGVGHLREWVKRRRRDDAERVASALQHTRENPRRWIPLTLLFYTAVPIALMLLYWDLEAVQMIVAAVLAATLLGSSVLLALITLGGGKAIGDLARGGPLDPDEALTYLHEQHGITETWRRRDGSLARMKDVHDRTKRICQLLLPGGGLPRRWLTRGVTEIGNTDVPPMFKSFVRLEVKGDDLVLTCHGVTGWSEHEHDVPLEDCVRIPLRR